MKFVRSKMQFADVVGALFCLLLPCRAQDFNCTAAQSHNDVTYKVSDESRPADYKASRCTYTWINATGYTIATNLKKESFLMESSINKLNASRCIENLVCKQHCTSEITGFVKDFFSNCSMRCAENSSFHGGNTGLIHENKDGWLIFGIVMMVAILVALSVFGLVHKCRDKIPSTCSCRSYRSGKRQIAKQEQPSV